jgi:NAD(P)-dependent dehydrogenase (short-subunit alcohol dehydrogenase family)
MELIQDKVTIVTGGASGNGRAIARALAKHGARTVIIADMREEPREGGEPTHELIAKESSAKSLFFSCDVQDSDSLKELIAKADGEGGVDVMVNNAGITGLASPIESFPDDEFDRVMGINLKGSYLGSKLAATGMMERGRGSIVNISSIAGLSASSSSGIYSASKAAIHLLTMALAREVGPYGVRANCVMPGIINTFMTTVDRPLASEENIEIMKSKIPLNRIGTTDDVANTVVYLASDLASYVTGTMVVVDGGYTCKMP